MTSNRISVTAIEGLAITLKRFSYPCRLNDLVVFFGRPPEAISRIHNEVAQFINDRFHHLLHWDPMRLTPAVLSEFCHKISQKGAPLDACFGFIDGTVRQICRPSRNQRLCYNGHKRKHALKFQSVTTPDGLIIHLFGPIEGRYHDVRLLRESGLGDTMIQHARDQSNRQLCVYGDPAYGVTSWLVSPFKGSKLTPQQEQFNSSMSAVRGTVEWGFQRIVTLWAFLDFAKNQKIYLQRVGMFYQFCTLMTNVHACYYKSQTSLYFNALPPTARQYLSR